MPDLEGNVLYSTAPEGSTLPNGTKATLVCSEGNAMEEVTPTRALSGVTKKAPIGNVHNKGITKGGKR